MLEQDGEEALDRTEQRAMDHHRALTGAVGCLVLKIEELGQVEINLNGRHLPGSTDRILGLNRDLRPVESCAAFVQDQFEPLLLGSDAKSLGSLCPYLVASDRLLGVASRQLKVKIIESVIAQ